MALTGGVALAWWTIVLAATAFYARRPTRAAVATAVVGAVLLAAVHGAGFATLTRWSYEWQSAIHGPYVCHGIAAWYAGWLLRGLVIEPATLVERGGPLLALAIAAVGILARRRDTIVPVLLGVVCVAPLAIVANPPDFRRALELPLTPVVFAAVAAAVAAALPTIAAPEHARGEA